MSWFVEDEAICKRCRSMCPHIRITKEQAQRLGSSSDFINTVWWKRNGMSKAGQVYQCKNHGYIGWWQTHHRKDTADWMDFADYQEKHPACLPSTDDPGEWH